MCSWLVCVGVISSDALFFIWIALWPLHREGAGARALCVWWSDFFSRSDFVIGFSARNSPRVGIFMSPLANNSVAHLRHFFRR